MFCIRGLIRKRVRAASAGLIFPAVCAFIAAAGLTPARATEQTVYDFTGASGSQPNSSLISDAKGALYGTTCYGGASQSQYEIGYGTVFKLTPPASGTGSWTETVLYSFMGGTTDGRCPVGNLVMDAQGALYGAVQMGGPLGQGYIFKLTPPASGTSAWTETILHSFGSSPDGNSPVAGVIFDAHGSLYGTTAYGGTANNGTVYKLTPPVSGNGAWTETIMYSFQGQPDGSYPIGSLVFDAKGALYGTTVWGGDTVSASNYGTVYKLTPSGTGEWTETVLHSFKGSTVSDGEYPNSGPIFDNKGALYGVTASGGGPRNGGTVYKLTPPASSVGNWTEQVLYSYKDNPNDPVGNVVFDAQGKLYGVTENGGAVKGEAGTVYSLTPPASGSKPWKLQVLYTFTCQSSSGCMPQAGLMWDASGALYGTTDTGGPVGSVAGAVFKLQCSKWSGTGAKKTCESW
ncbi:MAG: choice-of-anchor tandem repeat GloVer-containing protein [Rhodomicrobium sp.]